MPQYSSADQDRIVELVESGRVFPAISAAEERRELLNRLLGNTGRILSLNTLIHDTILLERPAKAFRALLPGNPKGSLRNALRKLYRPPQSPGSSEIQTSEHGFKTVYIRGDSFSLSLIQLWLFGLRHCVTPHVERKSSKKATIWPMEPFIIRRFANLAKRFGFMSQKVNELCNTDSDVTTMEQFLRALCRQEFYQIEDRKIRLLAVRFKDQLRILSRNCEEPQATPDFSTDDSSKAARRRYNSPSLDEYDRDRPCLFVEHVYSPIGQLKRYPTSFAVTREIFLSFFGRQLPFEILLPQEAPTLPVSAQEPRDSPSILQGGAEEERTEARSNGVEIVLDSCSPVEMSPHPSSNPDSLAAPMAPGFEDHTCIAPLETRTKISLPNSTQEVLHTWLNSNSGDLIVLFWFQSREYMKFLAQGGKLLEDTLKGLKGDHSLFTVHHNDDLEALENVYNDALRKHLVLVYNEGISGGMSLEELQAFLKSGRLHRSGKMSFKIDKPRTKTGFISSRTGAGSTSQKKMSTLKKRKIEEATKKTEEATMNTEKDPNAMDWSSNQN